MFKIFPNLACLLLCSVVTRTGAEPVQKLAKRVDFETVAFAQEDILEVIQDQIQTTILPELWRLSINYGDPSSQLTLVRTLYNNATPAIRNVTTEPVPIGTTTLQTDVELQLGMRLIRPFLDILVPLGRFDRTDSFMALLPPLESSFDALLSSVMGSWHDQFISTVSAGLVSGVEFDLLQQLKMFGALVNLGLTA